MQDILPHRCRGAMRERVAPCQLARSSPNSNPAALGLSIPRMAESPAGPSIVSELSPNPGPAGRDPSPEPDEETDGPKNLHRHLHHHHQFNGLLSPDLRHLKAVNLKRPEQPCGTRTAAPNGLDRCPEEALSTELAACTLRESASAELDLHNHHVPGQDEDNPTRYVRYESELQMPDIMRLITRDLSEPYSIYTYRYFIHNWPQLCFLAMVGDEYVGAIVCKLDMHKKMFRRGYIAMLAVDSKYRRKGIGTNLVKKAIYAMVEGDCDEVVLETEITNKSALKLYENLGFVRDKRLFRYYLNGVDALRLKLWLR
ncbi:N-alpha-acetyltransferase 30 [Bombina bombina]|uniref:N-alpha-acetyltransferase 30 n=1 Tax=Bombina bombina TaxID=8345 RepID=UPI00235A9370|nr:N-alpha-acetyltransferase 30 [Bombina bombina]